MKYKVGDKVRVRKDLEVGKRYGSDIFVPDMKKYAGKTITLVILSIVFHASLEK